MSLWGSISGLGSGLKDMTSAAVQLGQAALQNVGGDEGEEGLGARQTNADGWGSGGLDDVDLEDEQHGGEAESTPQRSTAAADGSATKRSSLTEGLSRALPSAAGVLQRITATDEDYPDEEEEEGDKVAAALSGFASRAGASLLSSFTAATASLPRGVETDDMEEGPALAGRQDAELLSVLRSSSQTAGEQATRMSTNAGQEDGRAVYSGSFAGPASGLGDARVRTEVQRLTAALAAAREDAAAEKSRAESFKAHVMKLEMCLAKTTEQMGEAEATWHAKLRDASAALKQQDEGREEAHNELKERVSFLEAVASEERSRREDAEAKQEATAEVIAAQKLERQRLMSEIDAINVQAASLQAQLSYAEAASAEAVSRAEEAAQARTQLLDSRLREAEQTTQALREQLASQAEQQQPDAAPADAAQAELRQQVQEAARAAEEHRAQTEAAESRAVCLKQQQVLQLQAAREEGEALRAAVSQRDAAVESLKGEVSALQQTLQSSAQAAAAAQSDSTTALQQAQAAATAHLAALDAAQEEKRVALAELLASREANRALESQLSQSRDSSAADAAHVRLQELEAQAAELTAALAAEKLAHTQARGELSHALADVEMKLEDSEQKLSEAVAVMQHRGEEIDTLHEQLSAARRQAVASRGQSDSSESARKQEQEVALQRDADSLRHEVQALKEQLERAEAAQETAESSYTSVDAELVSTRSTIAQLQDALESHRDEVASLSQAKQALQALLEQQQTDATEAASKLEAKRTSMLAEQEQLRAELASLTAQHESVQSSLASAQGEAVQLQELVSEARASQATAQAALQEAQDQLQTAEADVERAKAERKDDAARAAELSAELSAELQALQAKLEHTHASQSSQAAALEQQVEQLRVESGSLQQRLKDAVQRADSAEQSVAVEREAAAAAAARVEGLSAELGLARDEASSLQVKWTAASSSHSNLQSAFDKLQAEYSAAFKREEQLNRGRAKDAERIAELEGLVNNLRASLDDTAASGDSTARLLASSQSEVAGLQAQVRELFTQIERYRAAVEEANRERDESTGLVAELQGRIQTAESAWSSAQAQWAAREVTLSSSLVHAQSTIASLSGSKDDAERLQADLQAKEEELAGLQSSMQNLQLVVDALNGSRTALEGRELEALRARDEALAQLRQQQQLSSSRAEVPAADAGGDRESFTMPPSSSPSDVSTKLGQAQVRITTLNAQIFDLKAALRDTKAMSDARQAQSAEEGSVDKRLAAALVVAFLSLQRQSGRNLSFGSTRARDALSVLCGVLGMSAGEREAVGLTDAIEGVSSDASGGAGVITSAVGFLGSFLSPSKVAEGEGGLVVQAGEGAGGTGPPASLGSAFVQFLLAETGDVEEGARPEGAGKVEDGKVEAAASS